MMRRLSLLVLAVWTAVCGMAHETILTERYNLSYLDLSNGLPHNNVSCLYTDSNGFLWIATYGGGMVRYDGYGMMAPALGRPGCWLRA